MGIYVPKKRMSTYLEILEKAIQELTISAGEDGIISRADVRTKLMELDEATYRLVVLLYRFLLSVESGSSKRITIKDVEWTHNLLKQLMIARMDTEESFITGEEVYYIQQPARIMVELARAVKETAKEQMSPETNEIFKRLEALSIHLIFDFFGSEADMPVEAIHIEKKVEELTPEAVAKALELDQSNPSEVIYRFEAASSRFYGMFTDLHNSFEIPEAKEVLDILQEQLEDTSVIIQGEDNASVDSEHPVYILGIAPDQSLLGLRSAVIWT